MPLPDREQLLSAELLLIDLHLLPFGPVLFPLDLVNNSMNPILCLISILPAHIYLTISSTLHIPKDLFSLISPVLTSPTTLDTKVLTSLAERSAVVMLGASMLNS